MDISSSLPISANIKSALKKKSYNSVCLDIFTIVKYQAHKSRLFVLKNMFTFVSRHEVDVKTFSEFKHQGTFAMSTKAAITISLALFIQVGYG